MKKILSGISLMLSATAFAQKADIDNGYHFTTLHSKTEPYTQLVMTSVTRNENTSAILYFTLTDNQERTVSIGKNVNFLLDDGDTIKVYYRKSAKAKPQQVQGKTFYSTEFSVSVMPDQINELQQHNMNAIMLDVKNDNLEFDLIHSRDEIRKVLLR